MSLTKTYTMTDKQIEKKFDDWLASLDTSQNILEHLYGQRSFHFKFAKFLTAPKVEPGGFPFEIFWNDYDKKVGKPKTQKKWAKLGIKDQMKAINYLPLYKAAQPSKAFRKDPYSFLLNRSWEDEIIEKTTKATELSAAEIIQKKYGLK